MNMSGPNSQRVIGYVGHDTPIELILAADALPVAVQGRARHATPNADRYLEPTFLPSIRSIAEQWLTGELDDIEAVIFSRSDDSSQRLYYYLCELQRRGLCAGPKPLLYDLASVARTSSESHTVEATRALARELNAAQNALDEAIARVRDRMASMQAVAESASTQLAARGSCVQQRLRSAECDWTLQGDQALRAPDPSPSNPDAARVILIGSLPANEQLHEVVEQNAANIVATLNTQTPYRYDVMAQARDAYEHIARRCRAHPWRSMMQSPHTFCDRAAAVKADGAILWTLAEDTGLAWVVPRLERALRASGLPVLTLTMQSWQISSGALTEIADFARTLKVRA